jgi:hypothetical protein
MQRSSWLRIGAILTALYAAAHTCGMPWTPLTDTREQTVLAAMQGVRFSVFGVSRSYWDLYQGFGIAISALLFVQAALLWQCAAIARRGATDIRALIVSQFAGFFALAVVAAKYIFAPPLILAAAIALCLVGALIGSQTKVDASA